MAPHNREDLPQVAQFLAVNQKASTFPHYELISYLRSGLLTDIANALRVPVWDIAAFAKALLGA